MIRIIISKFSDKNKDKIFYLIKIHGNSGN